MLVEESVEIDLGEDPTIQKMVQFGKGIDIEELEGWTIEIKKRVKVFAYAYQDIYCLDSSIVVHHLTLKPNVKPIKKNHIECTL